MTAGDYFYKSADEQSELVKGQPCVRSPSGGTHGKYTARLAMLISPFIEKNNLGEFYGAETGFILFENPDTVRAPDYAFITKPRLSQIGNHDKFVPIPPDFAVEVISPNDRWQAVEEKVAEYLEAGVRLVWIVSPYVRSVYVYHESGDVAVVKQNGVLHGFDVLPNFSMPAKRLFR